MKSARLLGVAVALAIFGAVPSASAVVIDVVFTGLARGIRPTTVDNVYDLGSFSNKPFRAEFVFDTDKGILQTLSPGSYRLDGGLVSAWIDLGDDLGNWGGSSSYFYMGASFLTWQDDLSSVAANAGGLYHHLGMSTQTDGRSGGFQFGLCPTVVGGPCGYATTINSVALTNNTVPVPGPIAGAGLPGLALAFGGFFAWWRRRKTVPVAA